MRKPFKTIRFSAILLTAALQAAPPERASAVLAKRCYGCHTGAQLGGLRVASREALLKGGDSGTALVPGDPDRSLLIQAIRQTGPLKMPKGSKLSDQEIADLVEWVKS